MVLINKNKIILNLIYDLQQQQTESLPKRGWLIKTSTVLAMGARLSYESESEQFHYVVKTITIQ